MIAIHEVVPRDGFQIEPRFIPTEDKIALIDALSATGLAKIEVTSFVSPKAVPKLADAEAVMRGIRRHPDVRYVALIANLRGAERAAECGTDEVNLVVSVSESHNRANVNRSPQESFEGFKQIMAVVHGAGMRAVGSLSTSFGCPFEGEQPRGRLLEFIGRYVDLGVGSVVLADTTGMAHPRQVREIVDEISARWPGFPFALHFHNTRGMGLANVLAGLQGGITRFEACLGGLGGCPFAPGATGNICTEDLVHMLQAMGEPCRVDLDALIDCARRLESLVGHELPGQVMKAGRSSRLHPRPAGA